MTVYSARCAFSHCDLLPQVTQLRGRDDMERGPLRRLPRRGRKSPSLTRKYPRAVGLAEPRHASGGRRTVTPPCRRNRHSLPAPPLLPPPPFLTPVTPPN